MKRAKSLVVSATLAIASSVGAGAQTTDVSLLGYHGAAPAAWTARTPSSSSRLAEFVIAKGAPDSAEVVIYSFGPQMAANVDANLTRWRGNFTNPSGAPVSQTVTRDSSGAFPLTFAEYEGTYKRGVGAGSADSVRVGQRLISSIVETPKGVVFVQLFGPVARVATERERFIAFVKSIR